MRKCQGNLSAFKPNTLFGVPAVWEMIRKAAMGKVSQSGFVTSSAGGEEVAGPVRSRCELGDRHNGVESGQRGRRWAY